MKLFLRIGNLFPLFVALLIVGTSWKLVWQHLAARSRSRFWQTIAAAAAYQWP
jgi:hypothetical protein